MKLVMQSFTITFVAKFEKACGSYKSVFMYKYAEVHVHKYCTTLSVALTCAEDLCMRKKNYKHLGNRGTQENV